MAKANVHVIRGVVHWAKVLGDPVPNYNKDGKEWTLDLTPDEAGVAVLKELGVDDRIKNKGDERGDFIQFRQKEKRLDGSFNRRISVTDAKDKPWPQDKLIGNGSAVDLKFEYKDYGAGKKPGLYPKALRILDYNEYVRQEFAPLDEDDPYYRDMADEGGPVVEGRLPDGMEPELEEFPE